MSYYTSIWFEQLLVFVCVYVCLLVSFFISGFTMGFLFHVRLLIYFILYRYICFPQLPITHPLPNIGPERLILESVSYTNTPTRHPHDTNSWLECDRANMKETNIYKMHLIRLSPLIHRHAWMSPRLDALSNMIAFCDRLLICRSVWLCACVAQKWVCY